MRIHLKIYISCSCYWSFPGGAAVKNLPVSARDAREVGSILGQEMATHSSILAWEIPWTEEPGGLQLLAYSPQHDGFREQQSPSVWVSPTWSSGMFCSFI